MIGLIAVAGSILAVAASAQATTAAPIHQQDAMITQVVARISIRHTRRQARRCKLYGAGVCTR